MVYKVKVNNDKEFDLVRWNSGHFDADFTLLIQSSDFTEVKNAFSNIEVLEIYQGQNIVGTYTNFDKYDQISFTDKEFINELGFVDCMIVKLAKANLIEQVSRMDEQISKIDHQINPVVDVNKMSLDEYKAYKIKQIQEAVKADIFAGADVDLSNGTSEHFEFTTEDQSNIANLYMTVLSGNGKIATLPFHSHGNYCREYPVIDIIMLYIEMQKCITEKTTIANFTIQKVREAESKDEVSEIYYGMEFDDGTTAQIATILTSTMETINTMLEELGILPDTPDEEDDEEE